MKNRKLIKLMQERGWGHELTKNNHLKFIHNTTGEFIICAGSASDHRATQNMLSMAKRVEEGRVSARHIRQEEQV